MENFTRPCIRLSPNDIEQAAAAAGADNSSQETSSTSSSKLLRYHGLAAMNTTIFPAWHVYFEKLLEQPTEQLLVESYNSWIPAYELEIKPPSLCYRLLQVREQVAREFSNDLSVIANLGQATLDRYESNARYDRDERANLLFLEADPGDDSDHVSSPLRKGNFDLLILLCTQESVHRILNHQSSSNDRSSHYFLRNFYSVRLASHFSGTQSFGQADAFLEELFREMPRTVQVNEQLTALIDPSGVTKRILDERQKVALEWQKLCQDMPNKHVQIKRMQLNLLMGKPADTIPNEDAAFQ
jgi:hypothetical protein